MGENEGTRGKINGSQKLVNICGYELPTKLQNFTQKDLTEVKIFQKVLGKATFLKHLVYSGRLQLHRLKGMPCMTSLRNVMT